MPFLLEVKVDTNDGDYATNVSTIEKDVVDSLIPLIAAIECFKPYTVKKDNLTWTFRHNYPHGEYHPREDLGEKFPKQIYPDVDEELFEIFEEYVPSFSFHSVKSIKLFFVTEETRLL